MPNAIVRPASVAIAVAIACVTAAAAGCGAASSSTQTISPAAAAASRKADIRKLELLTRNRELREELADAKARKRAADAARADRREAERAPGGGDGGGGALTPDAAESFSALARELGGAIGLGVAPAGRGQSPTVMGELTSGSAWSTMKVPVAVAALASGKADQGVMERAITASDNAAAERLWAALGSPSQAGEAVQRQLAAAGDDATRVQTEVVRSGFSSFGQTDWTLDAQTRFIGGLPCVSDAGPVMSLMQQVESDQRWGLGTLSDAPAFKGGWGPSAEGGYLVRQMGVVRIHGKPVALTIMSKPSSGSFESGTADLTRIAAWAEKNVDTSGFPDEPRC